MISPHLLTAQVHRREKFPSWWVSAQRGNRERDRGGSLGVCGLAPALTLLGSGS